jgi:hypothetical protein
MTTTTTDREYWAVHRGQLTMLVDLIEGVSEGDRCLHRDCPAVAPFHAAIAELRRFVAAQPEHCEHLG